MRFGCTTLSRTTSKIWGNPHLSSGRNFSISGLSLFFFKWSFLFRLGRSLASLQWGHKMPFRHTLPQIWAHKELVFRNYTPVMRCKNTLHVTFRHPGQRPFPSLIILVQQNRHTWSFNTTERNILDICSHMDKMLGRQLPLVRHKGGTSQRKELNPPRRTTLTTSFSSAVMIRIKTNATFDVSYGPKQLFRC